MTEFMMRRCIRIRIPEWRAAGFILRCEHRRPAQWIRHPQSWIAEYIRVGQRQATGVRSGYE